VDKSTNIKERILQITDYKRISKERFFESIGMTYGNFKGKSKLTPINSSALVDILTICPEINIEWLLTGNGEMLKENLIIPNHLKVNDIKEIPLISIQKIGKFDKEEIPVTDIINSYKVPELEHKGVKYLIKVSDSSMYPQYNNGDVLACRPIMDLSFIQWGKAYVLDTEQGVIIKRLFPFENDHESLECHSENKTKYPPFRILKSSIKNTAIVVGVIRLE
jgi:repressor LexA